MNRSYLRATAVSALGFSLLFAAVAVYAPRPRMIWNASESVPIGLYRIDTGAVPAVGDLVAVTPGEALGAFLAERRYVPAGTPLLKRIAAAEGAAVCRRGAIVTIDGRNAATALARDRAGRALPRWAGCRTLGRGEKFLLNAAPASLDSRYFGSLPAASVIGVAHPVLTRDAPGAPLRWRLGAALPVSPADRKEQMP